MSAPQEEAPGASAETKESFSDAYNRAGKEKSSSVHYGSVKVEAKAMALKMKGKNDPNFVLKSEAADLLVASVANVDNPQMLDVGCAVGSDVGLLLERLDGRGQVYGVDIMPACLDVARKDYPSAKFSEGDVHAIPFGDESMDVVRCSRLLWHAKDLSLAVREMIRVLKPGGMGCFIEGAMNLGNFVSDDEKLREIHAKKTAYIRALSANPNAAVDAYKQLLTLDTVEDVRLEPSRPMFMLGNDENIMKLNYGMLEGMTKEKKLTNEELEYWKDTMPKAAASGNSIEVGLLMAINFRKMKK